jgi:hypothetical protein
VTAGSGTCEILDLVVSREAAGLATGVFQGAIDGDVELARSAGAQLDFRRTQSFEAIPHTEGLRLVASSAAVFDQDFHPVKVAAWARAIKGDIG